MKYCRLYQYFYSLTPLLQTVASNYIIIIINSNIYNHNNILSNNDARRGRSWNYSNKSNKINHNNQQKHQPEEELLE